MPVSGDEHGVTIGDLEEHHVPRTAKGNHEFPMMKS
jgi:hypothetical protein